ncbi:MAG: cation transport regulator ChaB [Francisella endosymbiont of Hyalomma asiaticum]
MPYNKLAELHKRVKNVLPYLLIMPGNNIEIKVIEELMMDLETIAREVAWSAVKKNIIKMNKQENSIKNNHAKYLAEFLVRE